MEMIGWAGYDFVVVDAEHGSGDWSDHLALVRAAQGSGVAAIVRPPTGATEHLKRVIDIGADGILIPNVDAAAMARRFVDDLLYPPAGKRGAAVPMIRASRYGLNA
ncbi:MAG: aldolase, partial [Polyangiaceae bacterium]|nr:aldolase [Polyangiaceae bacterium]